MKKILIALVALFAFSGFAIAAVDLNTADLKALESVKGIGPVKAKAIIDYRTKNGPFKSAADLDKVKGFGAKSISKMSSELTIDGKPLAPAQAPAAAPKAVEKAVKPAAAAAAPAAAAAAPAKGADTKDVAVDKMDKKPMDDKAKGGDKK